MKKLIEQIISGNATNAANLVEKALTKKLKVALTLERKNVAGEVYGLNEDTFVTDTVGLEGRIKLLEAQIQAGDVGGTRRAALRKAKDQLRAIKGR